MNPEPPAPSVLNSPLTIALTSVHLPLLLLGSAFFFYFLLETGGLRQGQESLKFQIASAEKRTAALKEAKDKTEKTIADRKPAADTSEATQKLFSSMMQDLIELARTNEDAKAIVNTYGIRMNNTDDAAGKTAEDAAK